MYIITRGRPPQDSSSVHMMRCISLCGQRNWKANITLIWEVNVPVKCKMSLNEGRHLFSFNGGILRTIVTGWAVIKQAVKFYVLCAYYLNNFTGPLQWLYWFLRILISFNGRTLWQQLKWLWLHTWAVNVHLLLSSMDCNCIITRRTSFDCLEKYKRNEPKLTTGRNVTSQKIIHLNIKI